MSELPKGWLKIRNTRYTDHSTSVFIRNGMLCVDCDAVIEVPVSVVRALLADIDKKETP